MSEPPPSPSKKEYSAADIQVLTGLAPVRRRPTMYIGSVDAHGLHQLLWFALGDFLDRYLRGTLHHIHVRLHADRRVTISAQDTLEALSNDELETRAAQFARNIQYLHACGRITSTTFKSMGEFMEDIVCVNALSERLVSVIRCGRNRWRRQEYERGELRQESESAESPWDVAITFWPDPTILTSTNFDRDLIFDRLRMLACLNPGLMIEVSDTRVASVGHCLYHYPEGVVAAVRHLNALRRSLHEPVVGTYVSDSLRIELAWQYTGGTTPRILTFVNNASGGDEQPHHDVLVAAIAETRQISIEDAFTGLTAVISMWHVDPPFEHWNQWRVADETVSHAVSAAVCAAESYSS